MSDLPPGVPKKRGRGRPKGSKNKKKVRYRYKPSETEKLALRDAKALIDHNFNEVKAYASVHPKQNPKSVIKNAHKITRPDVWQKVNELVQVDIEMSKERITKLYMTIITMFLNGDRRVKDSTFKAVIDKFANRFPEFNEKLNIIKEEKDISAIDKELKELGFDPDKLNRN